MWNKCNEDDVSGIRVRSFSHPNLDSTVITEEFDLGIFFGTYESRGLVSSKILKPKSCEQTIIVFFDEKDSRGLRDKYDKELLKQVKICSRNEPRKIENISVRNFNRILSQIIHLVPDSAWRSGAKWFIDIVGSPKLYFLSIIANLRRRIISPILYVFHPSGHYEKAESITNAFTFTSGFDQYIWVPWLWGRPIPALHWTYIFLLGFEGNRAYEVYNKFEPRFSKALIAKPGYMQNYVKKALDVNKPFLDESGSQVYYASASDLVESWKKLRLIFDDLKKPTNICIVPIGPKPHALAGGLTALCEVASSVLYLMPRSYNTHDVHPGEILWLYEIFL